ncbi:MAG: copper chaperone PCu(A)C [Gammaproteobacteria bacterium]|nr:copper chaperone PCu(A)C [Gammaproteobacteria bacterium]
MRKYLLLLLLLSSALNATPLEFADARIPEAPPGAQTMAAYMKIINDSDNEKAITAISSLEFGKVEMHRTSIEDGVARMRQLDALKIPAHSSLELVPGGIHLMLLEPEKEFMRGEMIVLYLTEADGTEHTLVVTIKKKQDQEQEHHHHHE